LQDWTQAAGLSAWLFANDATTKCFALYLEGQNQPVATGQIICQAGAFGGAPGEPLTASVSLNIQGYPDIKDPQGDSLRDDALTGTPATGVTAGSPGSFTPDGAVRPADLGTLQALGITDTAAWDIRAIGTVPEWVALGDGSNVQWNGVTWVTVTSVNFDVSDLAPGAAAMSDLTALQADGTEGDGNFSGGTFAPGQYITLQNAGLAHYDGSNWSSGPAT
jgi:hypothetical protein